MLFQLIARFGGANLKGGAAGDGSGAAGLVPQGQLATSARGPGGTDLDGGAHGPMDGFVCIAQIDRVGSEVGNGVS